MNATSSYKHLLDWDEADVHQWFSELGFAHYERQIRENNLRGDTLCLLDAEALKAIGVATVGQRLSILKAIYELKFSHKIQFEEDDYIPPSEVTESISIDAIHSSIKDQGQRIRVLEEDNRTINNAMRAFLDEITRLRTTMGLPAEETIRKQIPYLRSDIEEIGRAVLGSTASAHQQESPTQPSNALQTSSSHSTPASRSSNTDSTDTNKVTLDDPTTKVLPAALRKHRIHMDEWPNYAMLIIYGPPNNRTKRHLEHNDKPLFLFKKYKDAEMNPAFVLKNMKEQRTASIDNRSRESLSDAPNHLRAYPTPISSSSN